MKRILRPVAVALTLASSAGVASSQTETAPLERKPPSEIEQMLVDGLTKALNMLSYTWGSVVPYALPEIMPNGDIIIRRKGPRNQTEEPSGPEFI